MQEADPVIPGRAACRIAALVNDAADLLQRPDLFGVPAESVFNFGLLQHRIDAAKAVCLHVGHSIEPTKRVVEIRQCLTIGPAALRLLGCLDRVVHRLFRIVAAAEVIGEPFGDLVCASLVKLLEAQPDQPVQPAAVALEQARIRRLLAQRVAEDICGLLVLGLFVNEFQPYQITEMRRDRAAALPHRLQQMVGEFTADNGGRLQQTLGFFGKPIDARHHDVADRVGHQIGRSSAARLTGVQRELFEEQGVAVGLGNNGLGQRIFETSTRRAHHVEAVRAR